MRVGLVLGVARAVAPPASNDSFWRRSARLGCGAAIRAPFVDVVAEEGDQVRRGRGDVAVRRIAAPNSQCWQEAHGQSQPCPAARSRPGPCGCAPTGLTASPSMKRYQYQRSGCSPVTSTCTLCASSGAATALPLATIRGRPRRPPLPSAPSARAPAPRSASSGSGRIRVHRITEWAAGEPDATPRRERIPPRRGRRAQAVSAAPVAAAAARRAASMQEEAALLLHAYAVQIRRFDRRQLARLAVFAGGDIGEGRFGHFHDVATAAGCARHRPRR